MHGSIAFPVQVRTDSSRRGTASPELRPCAIANSLADTSAYVCLRVPAPRAPRSSSRRPFLCCLNSVASRSRAAHAVAVSLRLWPLRTHAPCTRAPAPASRPRSSARSPGASPAPARLRAPLALAPRALLLHATSSRRQHLPAAAAAPARAARSSAPHPLSLR
jgi:hypothetical protein